MYKTYVKHRHILVIVLTRETSIISQISGCPSDCVYVPLCHKLFMILKDMFFFANTVHLNQYEIYYIDKWLFLH